jgi:hypothetical protein
MRYIAVKDSSAWTTGISHTGTITIARLFEYSTVLQA